MKRILFLVLAFLVSVLPEAQARRWTPKPVSGGTLTLTYITNATDGTDTTTYSFASQSIGNPGDRDYVLVVFFSRCVGANNVSISSLTVGGNTGTVRSTYTHNDTTNSTIAAIYSAVVVSGTTATIDVTVSNTCAAAGIAVYTLKNASSIVPYATNGAGATTAGSIGLNTNTPSGDSVVLAGVIGTGPDTTMSWVGLNEDAEMFWDTNRNASVASITSNSASTPRSISMNPGTNLTMAGASACFQ